MDSARELFKNTFTSKQSNDLPHSSHFAPKSSTHHIDSGDQRAPERAVYARIGEDLAAIFRRPLAQCDNPTFLEKRSTGQYRASSALDHNGTSRSG
ncbi:hypothetical protein CEXT_515831 [Caerostris extrusa]|uniref:Uncharacterized protein n=1 Tax=Caerostris extrusa TaxID=172846 RepID=A0AAV4RPN1_CAEEX|nr:hypothetical protein CEXT_515831 [Caerostris extrusa]